MFVPLAVIAGLPAIAPNLSALTLRTCIFDPIISMDGRRSDYTALGRSAGYVYGLFRRHCIVCVGLVNGRYGVWNLRSADGSEEVRTRGRGGWGISYSCHLRGTLPP